MKKVFQQIFPNWQCCKLDTKNFIPFSLTFFQQLILLEDMSGAAVSLILYFLLDL